MAPERRTNNLTRVLFGQAARWFGKALATPQRTLTALSVLVGLTTGLGATAFAALIILVERLYFERLGGLLHEYGLELILLPLLPASGALLVGLITQFFAPEAEGHGVPEVMYAMAKERGRIRPRVASAKAVASALTIGSGGSAGTEGPIIQIGAAIGSGFGQWLRVNPADLRVLIGCGAAAGIASIFNAPIAGVLFAMEVLLRDTSLRSFIPIIVSSVFSSTVTQAILGRNEAIFPIPAQITGADVAHIYEYHWYELANYVVLGVLCGLMAVAFIWTLYRTEDLFRKLAVHPVVRPAIGGLLIGLVGILAAWLAPRHLPRVQGELLIRSTDPSVVARAEADRQIEEVPPAHQPPPIMGNGYPVIAQTLEPASYTDSVQIRWTLWFLLVLMAGKLLVTVVTLGSGGSGGVFAPSLYLGATLGGGFGLVLQWTGWFADLSPGAYALVGMAAVVAGSIRAPLTATLILFELTRDYRVILPIMIAGAVALAIAQRAEPSSIYTLKLLRRGIRFGTGPELRILQQISVQDIPRLEAVVVRPDDPVDELLRLGREHDATDFVVVDDKGLYLGMVTGETLRIALLEAEALPLLLVSELVRDDLPAVGLDETLDVVLDKFAGHHSACLPVVEAKRDGHIEGLLSRAAVMNRYHQALAEVRRRE
jgi:CIC family chloride channel protein